MYLLYKVIFVSSIIAVATEQWQVCHVPPLFHKCVIDTNFYWSSIRRNKTLRLSPASFGSDFELLRGSIWAQFLRYSKSISPLKNDQNKRNKGKIWKYNILEEYPVKTGDARVTISYSFLRLSIVDAKLAYQIIFLLTYDGS